MVRPTTKKSKTPRRWRAKMKSNKPSKKVSKLMRIIARREVHKAIEDKEMITPIVGDTYGSGPTQFGTTNFETNNIIDVTAETLQLVTQANGLTENGRIGNRITLKKCVLRGTVTPNSVQLYPHYLKMWVVSSKQFPNDCTVVQMRSICALSFFNTSPTSTSGGMSGQLIDLCRTINEDQLTLYATKVFKLGFQSLPNPGLTQAGNNDFAYGRTFTMYLGRHMNKKVVYNDTDTLPRNKKIFVVMEAIPADSSVANNNSYGLINYFLDMKYEDA